MRALPNGRWRTFAVQATCVLPFFTLAMRRYFLSGPANVRFSWCQAPPPLPNGDKAFLTLPVGVKIQLFTRESMDLWAPYLLNGTRTDFLAAGLRR